MDKRVWWLGLSFGLTLALPACESVDNCKPGEDGCIGGECMDGDCKFELQCVRDPDGISVCGEEQSDGTFDCGPVAQCSDGPGGDGDGDGDGDGGVVQLPCDCTGPEELCQPFTSNVCLNFCTDPGRLPLDERPNQENPSLCRAKPGTTALSYEEVCEATCRRNCANSAAFCTGFTCNVDEIDFCTSAQAITACMSVTTDVEALATACEGLQQVACDAFTCPDGYPRDCTSGFVCSNTCAMPEYNFDGSCDDGDPINARYTDCAWGTDCGDCGPRKAGTQYTVGTAKLGELCLFDPYCADHFEDLRRNKSWCLSVDGVPGNYRCMPDCSLSKSCPDGYQCVDINDGMGNQIV